MSDTSHVRNRVCFKGPRTIAYLRATQLKEAPEKIQILLKIKFSFSYIFMYRCFVSVVVVVVTHGTESLRTGPLQQKPEKKLNI